ncbi:MAG TPA: hypothetical protein PKD85_08015, partial [Saprospiraceae bacterium]|nr:hypothetical protein [Saprospiraceae bacterium]
MKLTPIFDKKRCWHQVKVQLINEWWMMLIAIIVGLVIARYYTYIESSFNAMDKDFTNVFERQLSIDIYYPSLIASMAIYLLMTSTKYKDPLFVASTYKLPTSLLEKLMVDLILLGLILPILHFILHNGHLYIKYNQFMFARLSVQPTYFDKHWLISYVKSLGLCFPLVSLFRLVDKRILWAIPILLIVYQLLKIFSPFLKLSKYFIGPRYSKIYEYPYSNFDIWIPLTLLFIGGLMH